MGAWAEYAEKIAENTQTGYAGSTQRSLSTWKRPGSEGPGSEGPGSEGPGSEGPGLENAPGRRCQPQAWSKTTLWPNSGP